MFGCLIETLTVRRVTQSVVTCEYKDKFNVAGMSQI